MAESDSPTWNPAAMFAGMLKAQSEAAGHALAWADGARELQQKWLDFQQQQELPDQLPPLMTDPAQWLEYLEAFYSQVPLANPEKQAGLWRQNVELWEQVLGEYGIGPKAATDDDPAH